MSGGFDPAALAAAVARHGRVARVVVAETKGSAPREAGRAMNTSRSPLTNTSV